MQIKTYLLGAAILLFSCSKTGSNEGQHPQQSSELISSLNAKEMQQLKEKIQSKAKEYHPLAVQIRRYLHQHPELSYYETESAKYIDSLLTDWGIPHSTGIGGNGIVAIIEGKNPTKKTIALRGDFDALPIQETNVCEYKSLKKNIMHACGHDAHTASLLTSTKILFELRNELEGTLKIIFQPAEERLPGGASLMIKDGVLKNPTVESIFGQHVSPEIPVGKVGFHAGPFMAAVDELYFTIKGKGGHGAKPHLAKDAVIAQAELILALQTITSRNADPISPTVLSIGKVQTVGGSTNVLPDTVLMEGTLRTFDENWRSEAHRRIHEIAEGIEKTAGVAIEVNIVKGFQVLQNHEELTLRAMKAAEDFLGKENVVLVPMRLGGEDFAGFTAIVPGCFYRLGVGNVAKGITAELHQSNFDLDEDALVTGAGLMAWLAVCELEAWE